MRVSTRLFWAVLVGVVFVAHGCTPASDRKLDAGTVVDASQAGADRALDETRHAGRTAADATKAAAEKAASTTKEVAAGVARTGQEVAVRTGAAATDGWITTTLKARLADDSALKGSDITVNTADRVVTLKGTVRSGEAKARAADIARGTDRVARVANHLVVVPHVPAS
jgi:hyperosmotically inducible periplasmic protein